MTEDNLLNYSELASELLKDQKSEWKLLADNYKALKNIKIKTFQFDGFKIKIQFNPGRIFSTTAEVDEESIKNRDCFLCKQNRPEEQRGIGYNENYLILCNPYPILPEHFTLTYKEHIPQSISIYFTDFLNLSKALSKKYSVIYNGPKCGASAPDHLHFQAGTKFYMPIDDEFNQLKNEYGEMLKDSENISVAGINDGIRKIVSIECNNVEILTNVFKVFYSGYKNLSGNIDEPFMNITSLYEKDFGWRVIIFLRSKHRSSHYYAVGEERILLSPASIDLGGICITPVEKDFNKLTKEKLTEIFREISLGKEQFDYIKSFLSQKLESI